MMHGSIVNKVVTLILWIPAHGRRVMHVWCNSVDVWYMWHNVMKDSNPSCSFLSLLHIFSTDQTYSRNSSVKSHLITCLYWFVHIVYLQFSLFLYSHHHWILHPRSNVLPCFHLQKVSGVVWSPMLTLLLPSKHYISYKLCLASDIQFSMDFLESRRGCCLGSPELVQHLLGYAQQSSSYGRESSHLLI